jgi:hypothetical protein
MEAQTLQTFWNELRTRYPADFTCSPERALEWQREAAEECEGQQQWAAAVFHYDQIIASRPEDKTARQRRARADALSNPDSPLYRQELAGHIPPRNPRAAPGMLDLTPFYNLALSDPLADDIHGISRRSFSELSGGLQRLGEVEFDVRGLIQLSTYQMAAFGVRPLPDQVTGIPVERPFQRLHLLHGTSGVVLPDGTEIATLVLHYADGSKHQISIRYGQDVRDSSAEPDSQAGAMAAWTGKTEDGEEIHLYRSTWENPQPGKVLASIDIVSAMTDASPLIVAITLE